MDVPSEDRAGRGRRDRTNRPRQLPWRWRALQGPRGQPRRQAAGDRRRNDAGILHTHHGRRCGWFSGSPHPPWPFTRRRVGLRGKRRTLAGRSPGRPRPRGLRLAFGAPAPRRLTVRRAEARRAGKPPLVGFVWVAPPSTCLRCVHSRRTSPPGIGPPGATREHPVPPAWFRTTSAACSASKVAGLLHPAADPGFAAFPDTLPAQPKPDGAEDALPRDASRPPKNSPRRQPHRVTTAVAPLSFRPDDRDGLRSAEADPHTVLRRPDRHRCRPDRAEVAGRLRGFAPPTSP
jgi:hypothetical protein